MYEFMAIGKPVIVSRLRTVEENFDDSCVMFFEPGNSDDLARCILELRRNARRREELVSNAYRRYQKMRWSVTKNTYRRIVEGMAVRPPQFKAAL
jgi:glycosyltransferase involved in cell wall biosynthesis